MIDETVVALYKEYLKHAKNQQAAALLAFAHVTSSVLYDLFDEKEKTVGVSLNLNTNLSTTDNNIKPMDPDEVKAKLWAARNPEQAQQWKDEQQTRMQRLANEVWK
jgi:hypothetical protein